MYRLLSVTVASALTLAALVAPARASELHNRTSVEVNTLRPNDRESVRVRNTTTFSGAIEQSVTTGYTQFFGDSSAELTLLEYSVKDELGTATITGTLGVTLADGAVYPRVRFSAAVPIQIGEDEPNAQLSGEVSYSLLEESADTVELGLTRVTLEPKLRWTIDPHTNLLVVYQVASISDGNLQNRINLRVEHQLGGGVYIAPTATLFTNSRETDNYWSPESHWTAGVEVGVSFPLSDDVACRVGVRPGLVVNENNPRFAVGGGGGCRFNIGERTGVEARAIVGYGLNATVEVRQQF